MRPTLLLAVLSVIVTGGAAAPRPAAPLISAGEQVARRNCAECHALAPHQASPYADAPPFPLLRSRLSRGQMARVIAQRMETIHPRMPKLELDVDEVDAFLDYWQGLAPSKHRKAPRPAT